MGFLVGYDTALSSVTFYVNEDRFPCYNGKDARLLRPPLRGRAGKARITPFVLGVKDGHVSVFGGDVLDDNMSKYNFADKYEAIDICNDLGLDSSPVVEYFRRIEEGEV